MFPGKDAKTGTTIQPRPTDVAPTSDVDNPTSFDQPTHPERPNRHISQKPSTPLAFYGPKGACWGNVEQKYKANVSG